jgi:ABC-type Mn2+/Zn2+ transport system ATPase subunit
MTPNVLLVARDLAVGYGGVPILRDVDVTIRRGECVAVVGANGSGKTTLFRTLAGIIAPLAGTITTSAGDVETRPALGYVPQRDQLDAVFPLTVAEIVRMGAYRRWFPLAAPGEARASAVAAALAKVGASGWERRTLRELSGGERQRVLIARALVAHSDLLFLDEPTTGIDADSEAAISTELRRCRIAGIGMLVVTHDLPALRDVATRVLVVENGRVAERDADEMLRRATGAAPV